MNDLETNLNFPWTQTLKKKKKIDRALMKKTLHAQATYCWINKGEENGGP